jgi:hypothetical protein
MTNGLIQPSQRFRQEIQPALDDYLKDPLSRRLANNLARAVDHQVDWTFEYYNQTDPSRLNGAKDVKSFRRQLIGQCPELHMMNDLVDASHHRFLTRDNIPARITVQSSAAYSVQANSAHPGGGVQLYIQVKRHSCQPQRRQSTSGSRLAVLTALNMRRRDCRTSKDSGLHSVKSPPVRVAYRLW